jgi:hypothetical protein
MELFYVYIVVWLRLCLYNTGKSRLQTTNKLNTSVGTTTALFTSCFLGLSFINFHLTLIQMHGNFLLFGSPQDPCAAYHNSGKGQRENKVQPNPWRKYMPIGTGSKVEKGSTEEGLGTVSLGERSAA